jgi:hypothetical protein
MIIRSFRKEDWLQVKEIYEQGIATGQATFETTAPSLEKWKSTIVANLCLVAEDEEGIQGWCKISKVSDRCVYERSGRGKCVCSRRKSWKRSGEATSTSHNQRIRGKRILDINCGNFP